MSDLLVMTFDNSTDATDALRSLRQIERSGKIQFTDTAVISRDASGKLHVKNELDSGVEAGIVGGGLLGLILNFIFPIAGLVIGAAGGALVGRLLDLGVDQDFVKDVSQNLKPNSSALFLIVRGSDPTVVPASLRPYKGNVYQTTLTPDVEEELRHALK